MGVETTCFIQFLKQTTEPMRCESTNRAREYYMEFQFLLFHANRMSFFLRFKLIYSCCFSFQLPFFPGISLSAFITMFARQINSNSNLGFCVFKVTIFLSYRLFTLDLGLICNHIVQFSLIQYSSNSNVSKPLKIKNLFARKWTMQKFSFLMLIPCSLLLRLTIKLWFVWMNVD